MSRKKMALFLCMGGGVVLLFALISFLGNLRSSLTYLDAHIELAQNELLNAGQPLPEVVALEGKLQGQQASLDALSGVESSIQAARYDWPALMQAMGDYDASRLNLASFKQEGRRITLNGTAADDLAVVTYARSLEASGLFTRVVIQSIKVINAPFTGMQGEDATGGSVPVTHTPTATAAPGDAYESDNVDPKSIFPGQPQSHTFWPDGDIDRVKLLAKAGRYYRISTSKLASGVDTLVAVSIGGHLYSGDDRQPGDLSTEVVFRAEGSQDVEALIEVTNRGEYGADKSYQLAVDEVIPTPTAVPTMIPTHVPPTATHIPPTVFVPTATHRPTATFVPTAAPTQIVLPTATMAPTATSIPTATPTFDLRDRYEPDEHTPSEIALGETQAHTFYPSNDIDRVRFIASGAADAPTTYRVRTSGLAPGVDTILFVLAGSSSYVNNDCQEGDLASEVNFQVGAGETLDVLVEVFNNRESYGPAQGYRLSVEVVAAEPAAEPTTEAENRTAGQRRAPGLASVRYPARASNSAVISLQGQTGTEANTSGQVAKSVEFVIILEPRS